MKYKDFKVKEATGIFLWFLEKMGWWGWTSIWNTIYIHPSHLDNSRLIKHEQVHAMQIQRDGYLWQPIKYAYYWIKFGYRNNPYEVEAREGETK